MKPKKQSWLAIMGIALSLPTAIFGMAYGIFLLADMGYINKGVGILILIIFVFNAFYLMIRHARKDK
ncbi:MAG: hypothetical protein ACPGJV_09390 [Bacteriovoracaceae bacterium]